MSGEHRRNAPSRVRDHISLNQQPPARRQSRALELAIVVAVFATAPRGAAQTPVNAAGPRLELWGGISAAVTGPSGDVRSSYSPPLLLDGEFTSQGAQTIAFGTIRSLVAGFQGGTNLFLSPHAGIQLLFDRASTDSTGVSTPHNVTLQYISRQPPNDQPVAVDLRETTPWPTIAGSMTQSSAALNGVIRAGDTARASVTVSGGLSYYRLSGSVQPIGFTTFHLGGRSVLFEDGYRLAVALESTSGVGFNAGGDINVAVGRHVALIAGYRYLGGPAIDVPLRPATILNADQITFQQPIADIAERLALPPARVAVAGSRLAVGLKVMR